MGSILFLINDVIDDVTIKWPCWHLLNAQAISLIITMHSYKIIGKGVLELFGNKNMTFDPDLHSQDAFIWSWSYYEMWLSPHTLSAHQVWRHLAQPFTRYRTKGNWVRPRVDIRARMRINSMLYGYNTWIAIKSPSVNGHFKRLLHVEMSRQRFWMYKIRMTVADRQWWRYFLQSCMDPLLVPNDLL